MLYSSLLSLALALALDPRQHHRSLQVQKVVFLRQLRSVRLHANFPKSETAVD